MRHGGALQLHAGLPQFSVEPRADHLRLRAQERDRRQPVPRQHAQGVLRRRGDQGERLRLWLAPQAERRQGLRHPADVRGCARREAEAPLDRRPESRRHRAQPHADCSTAMAKLETLVVQEIWETETAAFWRRPGVDPKSISTEVILLPAAFFMEKNGTISNSGGMVQWRHAAVKPPGQARPDGEIVDAVFRRVRDLVHDSKDPKDEIVNKAFWTYTTAEDVLREINGYALRDNPETGLKAGDLVRKVSDLRADGSTSSGAWIYAGVFANGENLSKRRDSQTDPGGLGLYPGFGWTWPNNMRILYNRASCDRNGKPYPGSKPIVWWDEQAKRWTGYDVPDVPVLTDGPDTPNGQRAFHLGAEGVGRLFAAVYSDPDEKNPGYPRDVAYVPKDGPLPEMYEPVESPVENVLHPSVNSNPMLKYPRVATHQPIGTADKYPYVLMTSTVAEHWCAGSTTRNIPWLNELVPEPVLELPRHPRRRSSK